MFRKLISQTKVWLAGGVCHLILAQKRDQLILQAERQKRPLPFGKLQTQFPSLEFLVPYWDKSATQSIIPWEKLADLRTQLLNITIEGLTITISPELLLLKTVPTPENFEVRYGWNQAGGYLQQTTKPQATYLRNGWFMGQDEMWQIAGTKPIDRPWLQKTKISGSDVISFLQDVLPNWQARKLPCFSLLQHSPEPVLSIQVNSVTARKVQLTTSWHEPPEWIREVPVPGYVLTGVTFRPGLSPAQLPLPTLQQSNTTTLTDDEIPAFMTTVLPLVKQWTSGINDLLAQHMLINDGSLQLVVVRSEQKGIGRAMAVPTLVSNQHHIPAAELVERASTSAPYLRYEPYWVSAEAAWQAGVRPHDLRIAGISLQPKPLSPNDISRSGQTLKNHVWQDLSFPNVPKPTNSEEHLAHLREWGISGGLVGSMRQLPAFHQLCQTVLAKYKAGRILVVAQTATLNRLEQEWADVVTLRLNGNRRDPAFSDFSSGVLLARPKAIENKEEITRAKWQVLCLLPADELVKSDRSKLYRRLSGCQHRLAISLFTSYQFLQSTPQRTALSHIYGFNPAGDSHLWQRYCFNALTSRSTQAVDVQVGQSRTSGRAIPIPRRAGFREPVFVPFMQYYPGREDMNPAQRRWYDHWRQEVQKGNYPETDLSYIFAHVYDLLVKKGVRSTAEGYIQIYTLWQQYRASFPKLDNYLIDWLADYAIYYRLPNPLQIYQDPALQNSTLYRDTDLHLHFYADKAWSDIPITLLDQLIDYDLLDSRFYRASNAHTQLLTSQLHHVLTAIEKAEGQRILDRFAPSQSVQIKRRLFSSVRLHNRRLQHKEIVVATIKPYSQNPHLRLFLTGIIKHTENQLREQKSFSGRLRNYHLPAQTEQFINRLIQQQSEIINPPPPKPKVNVDLAKIADLQAESDSVFEMLRLDDDEKSETLTEPPTPPLAKVEIDLDKVASLQTRSDAVFDLLKTAEETVDPPSHVTPPLSTPSPTPFSTNAGDVDDEWIEFAQQLSEAQRAVLERVLTEDAGADTLEKIAEQYITMPALLLDSINEIAQDTIGDLLLDPALQLTDEEYLEPLQVIIQT